MSVTFNNLGKEFDTAQGPKQIFVDINEEIKSGEFVTIVGPSGCGKTTLLRIVQGLEAATTGSVGFDLSENARVPTSFVFQSASLLPWLTVARNIDFGLRMRVVKNHLSKERREERLNEVLEIIGLQDYRDYYPAQLSGGMQQRVNLARGLSLRPEVLLLDEPFSALDAQTRENLQIELRRIAEELGTTMMFITHDIREATFLGDRVLVMAPNPGRIQHRVTIEHSGPRDQEFYQSTELAAKSQEVWRLLDSLNKRPELERD